MNPITMTSLFNIGNKIIDKLFPDPEKKAQAQLELLKLQQSGELAQMGADLQLMLAQADINKVDAQSSSNFRGGWRPFIGWVCGLGLTYQFLIRPLANGVFSYLGHGLPMPDLDTTTLFGLVTGMLGFGGLRTVEKIKGIS